MKSGVNRSYWIDNLRSFITVLVLAHHASLAYTTFTVFDKTTYINSTHPVADNSRWIGLDVFANFNDSFFMSLMFFISGLFFFSGLRNKGRLRLLADRGKRLGLAFVFAEVFIIPLAYIPSYLLVNQHFKPGLFISDYLIHQQWPVGPPWFIWLLLSFNCLAALIPKSFYIKMSVVLMKLYCRPFLFFLTLFFVAAFLLIPLSLWVGQYTWTGVGPFDFQLNRVLFYFGYFIFGAIFGVVDWQKYLFSGDRLLHWSSLTWTAFSLLLFATIEIFAFQGYRLFAVLHINRFFWDLTFMILFTAAGLTICFTFIAIFKNKLNRTSIIWRSLSANAYGIYLVHYVFVTWLQFALLDAALPAVLKFLVVFVMSFAASWALIYCLKKIGVVSAII